MSAGFWVLICIFVPLIVLVSGYAAGLDARERAEWQLFVDTHDCHIVEITDPQTDTSFGPGIGFDGKLSLIQQTTHRPGQECWLCSNGIRYWKVAGFAIDRQRGVSE